MAMAVLWGPRSLVGSVRVAAPGGQASAHSVRLQDANALVILSDLRAALPGAEVGINPAGRAVITAAQPFSLLFSGAGLDARWFGFENRDYASVTRLESPFVIGGLWLPGRDPESDTQDEPRVIAAYSESMGGRAAISYFGQAGIRRTLSFGLIQKEQGSHRHALGYSDIQTAWRLGFGAGGFIWICPDERNLPRHTRYLCRAPASDPVEPDNRFPSARFVVRLELVRA